MSEKRYSSREMVFFIIIAVAISTLGGIWICNSQPTFEEKLEAAVELEAMPPALTETRAKRAAKLKDIIQKEELNALERYGMFYYRAGYNQRLAEERGQQ